MAIVRSKNFERQFNKFSHWVSILLISIIFTSCASSKIYTPAKKFPQKILQQEFLLLQNILEQKHPSLYWYTSKDSMDIYFDKYYKAIGDSMTEPQFAWQILAPLINKIHCGHTSVGFSKAYTKWARGRSFPSFPLYMKIWNDTMAVIGNLHRNDSIFKRGTLITAINGVSNQQLINKMFDYFSTDGYAKNFNYIKLSSNFPYYHRNIFGLRQKYKVTYIDTAGIEKTTELLYYKPPIDSLKKDSLIKVKKPKKIKKEKVPKEKRLLQHRSLKIDSSGLFAIMTLNTFSKGNLRRFFKRSFHTLKQQKINNLILDIRSNGGGRVGLSTLLTKYISRLPFKVADSLYAVSKTLGPYTKYIKGKFLNNIELFFISRRKADGLYHVRQLENKIYYPKRNNAYRGDVYVLINGPTFSASTVFCNAVKGQQGITLLGEETGGGWYGNSGIMIPDIILPNTHVRVGLPLFRLVQYNHVEKKGTGIPPDIYVGTSYDALLKGYDKKMQVVKEIIMNKRKTK